MPEEPYEDIAIAAPQARPHETESRHGLMLALCGRRFGGELDEIPDISSPITASEAQAFVYADLGIKRSHTMWLALNACWLRLMAARTAEQRLSLERMITAFAIGIGMTRHKEAAKIIASNEAARVAKDEADARERALDRWRNFPAGGQTEVSAAAPADPQSPKFSDSSKPFCNERSAAAPSGSLPSMRD